MIWRTIGIGSSSFHIGLITTNKPPVQVWEDKAVINHLAQPVNLYIQEVRSEKQT